MYDDEDQGKALRHGFEPPSEVPVGESSEFAVGEDDEDKSSEHSQKATSPVDELDDRHVWADSNNK